MHPVESVGLCFTCLHSRQIKSGRGSLFWLCQKSETDPRFVKYPALPVRVCSGFEEREEGKGKREV